MGNMDYKLISFQTAVTDIEDIIRQARTTAYQSVSVTADPDELEYRKTDC